MATVKLGSKAVGSVVKIKNATVTESYAEFIVMQHGAPSSLYDSSFNDTTWLLRKDIYGTRPWHSSNVNDYANSDMHAYLNDTFLNIIESSIRNKIVQVKIPYCAGNGSSVVYSGSDGLSTKAFLPSAYEMGWTTNNAYNMPVDGTRLAGLSDASVRISRLNSQASYWYLRSPQTSNNNYVWYVQPSGVATNTYPTPNYGIRPCIVLPSSTIYVTDDDILAVNTAPTAPSNITVPSSISGGTSITITWGASTDAEGNLEGYIVQRSTDGGSTWAQVYQGSAQATTNTIAYGTASVIYRVKAYDSEGLESIWRTSSQVSVTNNTAPSTPASIAVPTTVTGGSSLLVSWGISTDSDGNLSGYCLERAIDGGAWTQIYKGTALSYTDTITKGWTSVAYRVRAYDAYSAYSGYTTSATRTINNNTAPVITCGSASGTNLGTKSAGYTISYSVADADSDAVTITEAIDGVTKRSFAAALGNTYSFAVTGDYFMQILNGSHTMTITANDGSTATTHTLYFTKLVTAASVIRTTPYSASSLVTVCVVSVSGNIPSDADFSVKVTNNPFDTNPVWEDCTTEVLKGVNHVFSNTTVTNGYGFACKVEISRGPSNTGGSISVVQGVFQSGS